MVKIDEQKIEEILSRGVEEVIVKDDLEKKLKSGKRLRVKFGIDPTTSELHLGHSVVLHKLKQFQDLGHKVILLIGDFTSTIGDPSGKSSTRPELTEKQARENMKDYIKQASIILDTKKAEIRYNTEWFKKFDLRKFYSLARIESVFDLMQRSMFRERMEKKEFLALSEFTYPLLQGYDSYELRADVELGGIDQLFNMKHGRELQKKLNQSPQDIMGLKLLIGLDGASKMSKSLGNHIALKNSPNDMYGKVMSIKDELITDYVELCTKLSKSEFESISNPRNQKTVLAKEIVKMYHGEKEAQKAEEEFNKTFRDKKPEFIDFSVDEVEHFYPELVSRIAGVSTSEAKRLITAGAVEINGTVDREWKKKIEINEEGTEIKVGKRTFVKVKLN